MSLLPGYKLVENFGPDNEYETAPDGGVIEQVSYVTLDIAGVDPTLLGSSSSYRLIGTDTPTPFLQLSGTVLKGQHQQLLGTELLFVDGKDDVDPTKKSLSLVGTTEQRIKFSPVEIIPKSRAQVDDTPTAPKGKKKKDLLADNVIGTVVSDDPPRKRRSKKGVGPSKNKGKEKALDVQEEDEGQPMDVVED